MSYKRETDAIMRVFYYFNPYDSDKGDYDKKEPVILNNILEKQKIKAAKF